MKNCFKRCLTLIILIKQKFGLLLHSWKEFKEQNRNISANSQELDKSQLIFVLRNFKQK